MLGVRMWFLVWLCVDVMVGVVLYGMGLCVLFFKEFVWIVILCWWC